MNIRTSVAMIASCALTLAVTQPWSDNSTTTVETFVRTEIQQVMETIDLDRLRQVPPESPIDDELNAECTYAIQRLTDEPLMGITLYLEQHWNGDACAAYEHQVLHGWY